VVFAGSEDQDPGNEVERTTAFERFLWLYFSRYKDEIYRKHRTPSLNDFELVLSCLKRVATATALL
jgi:hypothetical protein